jgi:hypothetical protein
MYDEHPDKEVAKAIVRLCDALCQYERATGIESVLIIREPGEYKYRALGGKPTVPDYVSDEQLIEMLNRR